jgi:hypothetical protein
MSDGDLDFSGFQADRKVDVPPPTRSKGGSTARGAKSAGKKGKKEAANGEAAGGRRADSKPELSEPVAPLKPSTRSKTGRKKRVNVSLPVELSRRFTDQAAREDRYLTDMVLDAYRNHYAEMLEEYVAERQEADLPFRPRRRKAASGRVTHMLYLAAPEIAVIDGSAVEIGLSRSELVSQLIDRELK